jgi:death on curing protein
MSAAYFFGLATSHGYVDGNKRIAAAAAFVFLDLNGYDIDRSDDELEDIAVAVADHRVTESELARWIREALVPLPPPGSDAPSSLRV